MPDKVAVSDKIRAIESKIRSVPEVLLGDCFPLRHTFARGIYVRELCVPAGALVVTKKHKFSHATFLLRGEISIMEESGPKRIVAPASFITPAGTKRAIFHHTDVVITTVHGTGSTDLEEIEKEIIEKEQADIEVLPETVEALKLEVGI